MPVKNFRIITGGTFQIVQKCSSRSEHDGPVDFVLSNPPGIEVPTDQRERYMVIEWAEALQERLHCMTGRQSLSFALRPPGEFAHNLERFRQLWREHTQSDVEKGFDDRRRVIMAENRLDEIYYGSRKWYDRTVLSWEAFFRRLKWAGMGVDTKVFILSGNQPDYPQLIKALEERAFSMVEQVMNQVCQHELPETNTKGPRPRCCLTKKMFSDEIRKQKIEVVKPALESGLSNALSKILRLSSRMGPSTARNRELRALLQATLSTLGDFSDRSDYRDCLHDFMQQHSAFCLALLKHADSIEAGGSRLPGGLCNDLQRLAKNLSGIASRRAEMYQTLYEAFVSKREELSLVLDSTGQGHGRSLVDNFTKNLKEMASHMRREADFWDSQSRHFQAWPDIVTTYQSAMNKMSNSEIEGHDSTEDSSLNVENATPSHPGPEPQLVAELAQTISTNLSNLHHLRPSRVRKFLIKAEPSVNRQLDETRAYLQCVVDNAQKPPQQSTRPSRVVIGIIQKASSVAKSWNKLHLKIKYGVRALTLFSSKIGVTSSALANELNLDLDVFSIDYQERMTVTIEIASKNLHPFLVDLELYLRAAKRNCLSLRDFCAHTLLVLDDAS